MERVYPFPVTRDELGLIIDGLAKLVSPTEREAAAILRRAQNVYEATAELEPAVASAPDKKLKLEINRARFAGYGVAAQMTGHDLRRLPSPVIPDDYDLWRVVPGHPDEIVKNDDVIDVAGHNGGLRLYSAPRFINAG